MKSLFRSLFLCLIAAATFAPAEEAQHPAKPLLWKIEGKDLAQPSYLFGTIHLGGGTLAKLHPTAEKAFQSCDVLYTEIPSDAKTQMLAAMKMMRQDNQTLSKSLGAERVKLAQAELQAINPQLDLAPFEPMKTWTLAMTLPMLKAQLLGEEAMDAVLWKRATQAKKSTDSIETAESQLALFDQFDESEQLALLDETLRMMKKDRESGKDSMQDLIDAYLSGEVDRVKKEIDQGVDEMRQGPNKELGERFFRMLLTERDQSMAKSIAEKLKAAPTKCHFFAAGAAHYAGEISIISHLRALGYEITRIER
jgi:uncharacterized protein YbaP (TraB family)